MHKEKRLSSRLSIELTFEIKGTKPITQIINNGINTNE